MIDGTSPRGREVELKRIDESIARLFAEGPIGTRRKGRDMSAKEEIAALAAELFGAIVDAGKDVVTEDDLEFLFGYVEDMAYSRVTLMAARASGDEFRARREEENIKILTALAASRASEKLINVPSVFRDQVLPAVLGTLGRILRLAIGI